MTDEELEVATAEVEERAARLDDAFAIQRKLLALTQALAVGFSLLLVGLGLAAIIGLKGLQRTATQLNEASEARTLILCEAANHTADELEALAAIARRLGLPVDFVVPERRDCGMTTPAALLAPALLALLLGSPAPAAAAAPPCGIEGSPAGNVVFGSAANEVICTDGGADYVEARGGRDVLDLGDDVDFGDGGDGPDLLLGGAGDDLLIGGPDHDKLRGGPGADTLDAGDGKGNDKVDGGAGADLCTGDPGDAFTECETILLEPAGQGGAAAARAAGCTINGSSGNDRLAGGSGSDTICAKAGNDQATGGGSGDLLRAGRGNDYASGDEGNDALRGRSGNDTLVGGAGADQVLGGGGDDKIFTIDQAAGDHLDAGPGTNDYCFGDGGDSFAGCEHVTKP